MLHLTLQAKLQTAVRAVLPDADPAAVLVRPCPDARHGDYQSNALIALAKQRKLNPRQLAEQVKAALDVADLCDAVDIAGPGFLNFRVRPAALAGVLQAEALKEQPFVPQAVQPRTVVIDFSSPNVAKPMHVGHIRSTGIGDALQRVFRLLGHRVVTDNHIGDWGTQFGKLLLGWKQILDRDALARAPIAELERLYQVINAECDANPARLKSMTTVRGWRRPSRSW
jgi:arginyl-tRNA synthetase